MGVDATGDLRARDTAGTEKRGAPPEHKVRLQGEVAPGTGAGDIVRRLDGAALGGALGALDLDARLSPEQQADLAAFQALVGVSLAEATLWITWGDAEAYTRYTRAAYSSRLPAPLSYLVPRGQRKQVLRDLERNANQHVGVALARQEGVPRRCGGGYHGPASPGGVPRLPPESPPRSPARAVPVDGC